MKNKKGFTLIELLAVIIILGILMIIAIPSVTQYINNSRKSAYVDTAKEIVAGARNKVNEGKLEMFSTETTYYIPASCIGTENGQKSPYGDFDQAYVLVTYDGHGYKYYWVSRDVTGQGVKDPVEASILTEEDIESDIAFDYIKTDVKKDGTTKVKVMSKEDCSSYDFAKYPEGKNKSSVEVGDIVTIGTEDFYVIKPLTDGKLTLLSRYNLNVGGNKKAGATEGLQDSEVKGYVSSGTIYGTIAFSSTNYWNGKVGSGLDYTGSYCSSSTYTAGTECAYVYDSNSNLKTYVDAYKETLIEMGQPVEEARLLRVEEAYELGCGNGAWNCDSAQDFVKETSYWLGSAEYASTLWRVNSNGDFNNNVYSNVGFYGVRPVIVI